MVIDAQNDTIDAMTLADEFFFSSRMPFKLALLTDHGASAVARARSAYDYDLVTSLGVQKYISNDDKRWSELRVAYTVITPFLSRLPGGGWRGLDWSLWGIICKTLGMDLDMAEEHGTYASAYDSLANKSVDLTFPQNPFSFPLRQVSKNSMPVHFSIYHNQ